MSNEEETLAPRGLVYVPDFIAPEIATRLEAELTADKRWAPVSADSVNARCVIQYGYRYDYSGRGQLAAGDPIPEAYARLVTSLATTRPFDQLIINRYLPGQGIGPHIDHATLFGPVVACITLGSGCEIIFTRGESVVRRYIAPCSLYMMTADSRYLWQHRIAPVKSDIIAGQRIPRGIRYSLTFRTANNIQSTKNEEGGT
jgi:alkylated DNA repair dioxygenase AlkB